MIGRLLTSRVGLAVILLAAVGWQGYRMGGQHCQAAHDAERLARIEAGRKLEAERIAAMRARDELARQLEDAANAAPVVVPECLGRDRVRRLNQLR